MVVVLFIVYARLVTDTTLRQAASSAYDWTTQDAIPWVQDVWDDSKKDRR
jgi:hypothetical protein